MHELGPFLILRRHLPFWLLAVAVLISPSHGQASVQRSLGTDGNILVTTGREMPPNWPLFFVAQSYQPIANASELRFQWTFRRLSTSDQPTAGNGVAAQGNGNTTTNLDALLRTEMDAGPGPFQPIAWFDPVPDSSATTFPQPLPSLYASVAENGISSGNGTAPSMDGLDQGCVTSAGRLHTPCLGTTIAKCFPHVGYYTVRLDVYHSATQLLQTSVEVTVLITFKVYGTQQLAVRQEIRKLPEPDWWKLVQAFYTVKDLGIYDLLVAVHKQSMFFVYDPLYPDSNISHGGPAFPPWYIRANLGPWKYPVHRTYLRILEMAMGMFSGVESMAMPYWDWTVDGDAKPQQSWETNPLWTDRFFGPNGDPWTTEVKSGPFCSVKSENCTGRWPIRTDLEGPTLNRQLGARYKALPTSAIVQNMKDQKEYDLPPYRNQTNGFRGALEGWGTIGHNSVHQYVGGSLAQFSSPNDPVFFFHHSYTDKIWLEWQRIRQCFATCYPLGEGDATNNNETNGIPDNLQVPGAKWDAQRQQWRLPGQHWNDPLWPWLVPVRDVSDRHTSTLGYVYYD